MENLSAIRSQLESLERNMLETATRAAACIGSVHPEQQQSVRNLLHYLTLRREDLRDLQDELHERGLSSLASAEGHILRQVQAVLQRLGKEYSSEDISTCTAEYGRSILNRQSLALFGEQRDRPIPWIMVTCDPSVTADVEKLRKLLVHGMNVARINCAHDDKAEWTKMIASIRQASKDTGLPCEIYMDLAGPKMRTVFPRKDKTQISIEEGSELELVEIYAARKKGPEVACTLPGVVAKLEQGHRVLFDDGVIESVVESSGAGRVRLRIMRISSRKPVLKAEKGINFPDSSLDIPPLTDFDRECLPFIAAHAALVGFSFVETGSGIAELQQSLADLPARNVSIILKIERAAAVRNLPDLLLQGMKQRAFGVMIARGDLAIEIGFQRLSEIQEEILWLCEAAQVPVIWATQVLDNLNKVGLATRSEITDAMVAAGAECVMINKGGHLVQVIDSLRDILQRSRGHHLKKRFLFRPLSIAGAFMKKI